MKTSTIFALALASLTVSGPATAAAYHVLYQFHVTADNQQPATIVIGRDSSLYGTTATVSGCTQNCGTLFKIAPDGTFSTLYAFPDYAPGDDLLQDRAGNFYIGSNVASKIAPDGSETTLHNFAGDTEGRGPRLSVRTKSGDLYGVTLAGGEEGGGGDCDGAGCGSIFKIASTGEFSVLHLFAHGDKPGRMVRDKAGNLFGSTLTGGVYVEGCSNLVDYDGCGTIFKLAPDGTMTTLYEFQGDSDGSAPKLQFMDKHDDLYGVTTESNAGTVFKITPDGTKTILYAFAGGADGREPSSLVQDDHGNLFGATQYGGELSSCDGKGCGVIFKLAPNGDQTVLYAFKGKHIGIHPVQIVLSPQGRRLYGVTAAGPCKHGACGTVFRLNLR